jgi:hypothetical protein
VHETELLILGLCVAIPMLSVSARLLDIPYPQPPPSLSAGTDEFTRVLTFSDALYAPPCMETAAFAD